MPEALIAMRKEEGSIKRRRRGRQGCWTLGARGGEDRADKTGTPAAALHPRSPRGWPRPRARGLISAAVDAWYAPGGVSRRRNRRWQPSRSQSVTEIGHDVWMAHHSTGLNGREGRPVAREKKIEKESGDG